MPDWWAIGTPLLQNRAEVDTEDLAPASIATATIADVNVTSEKLSANALRRTVICPLPDLAAADAGFTSAYKVWTPSTPVILRDLGLTALTSWVQTTVQSTVVGTLYNGANAVATVVIPTTNAPARGSRLTFSALANASVASGTALTFAMPLATSVGMNAPSMALEIAYDSTA